MMMKMAMSGDGRGGRVTVLACGGIVSIHLTANLPRNLPVNFFKSVKI